MTGSSDASHSVIQPLLDIAGLDIFYRGRQGIHHAVRNVGFSLEAGSFTAIVGQSGSGKSTTVHAVIDLLPRAAERQARKILFDGTDLTTLTQKQLRAIRGKDIALVPQDPTISLDPVKTIGSQIMEALEVHDILRGREAADRAISLLAEVGIDRPADRFRQYPHEISGGMRQRVLIAMALSCDPKLIIADEPTSGLDVTVQKRVLDRMEKLTRERNAAVLFITHDLGVAADRADRIIVMNEGQIVEDGSSANVIHRPSHAYTRALLADIPPRPAVSTAAIIKASEDHAGEALLVASHLSRDFSSDWLRKSNVTRAVDQVSLTIEQGRTLALVGESGSGKTTMARMVAGLTRPTSGTLTIDGKPVRNASGKLRSDYPSLVQFVYQNPYSSLDPRWRVEDIIRDPLRVNRIGEVSEQKRRVEELAEAVALPAALLKHRASELSGGQLQRVAIARALSLKPRLLVLDEPTSALDVTVQARIIALLQSLQQDLGLSYLFVTHDLAVVNILAHTVAVMKAGRLVESGPKHILFNTPSDPYTRALIEAVPGRDLPTLTAHDNATLPHLRDGASTAIR